jgi:hypothetical protein
MAGRRTFKTEVYQIILKKFSPYLTGNTPRFHGNDQPVNAA